MWTRVRAWWYLRGKPEDIPRDVREYIMRRYLPVLIEGARSPEQKVELSVDVMTAALSLEADEISSESRDKLIEIGMKLLDGLVGDCAQCGHVGYIHEMVKVEDKLYCKRHGLATQRAAAPDER